MKNFRLKVYIALEAFLLILIWLIYNNVGKLGQVSGMQTADKLASGLFQNLYILLTVFFFIPFLALFILIIIDLYQIRKAKREKLEKAEQTLTDLLTITEGETEEQKEERETRIKERYRILKEDLLKKIDDQLVKTDKGNHKLVSEKILSSISKFYEITQAEIFLKEGNEEDEKMVLSATYAFYVPEEKVFEFRPGEGLIGQVAKAGTPLYLNNIPEGYITVKTGLGSATPSHLLICPWKDKNNNLFGVIEVAAFREFSKEDIELFEDISKKLVDYYVKKGK